MEHLWSVLLFVSVFIVLPIALWRHGKTWRPDLKKRPNLARDFWFLVIIGAVVVAIIAAYHVFGGAD